MNKINYDYKKISSYKDVQIGYIIDIDRFWFCKVLIGNLKKNPKFANIYASSYLSLSLK
jgi:hypothetical protein